MITMGKMQSMLYLFILLFILKSNTETRFENSLSGQNQFSLSFFFKDFTYSFERDRESISQWGEAEEKQTPGVGSPTRGSVPEPRDYDPKADA